MQVTFVVSVVLLGACVGSTEERGLLEDSRELENVSQFYKRKATPDYVSLGCFDFQYLKKRNILGANLKSESRAEPFETCSQIAKDRRVQKFGIRKKKGQIQCQMIEKEWYSNAKKSKKCKEKAGSGKSIFIYRLADTHCEVNKTVYWNGEEAQQYDSSAHWCKTCKCIQGQMANCIIADCADISRCPGDFYTPEGQCCPICKPRPCGLGRKPEDRWFWWRAETKECFYCRCLLGDRADCRKTYSPPHCDSCYSPSISRNPCCEACPHTTEISFTIQLRRNFPEDIIGV
ncbi:uncharacterized protein LOC141881127 isoform X2 [Acropora palmata]